MTDANKDQELIEIFIEEANDLVSALSLTLRGWEENLQDRSKITDLKRDLHTLKGSARMVGQMSIGSLAHAMETLASYLEKQGFAIDQRNFNVIVEGLDQISIMVEALKNQESLPSADIILEKIQQILPFEAASLKKSEAKMEDRVTSTRAASEPVIIKDSGMRDEKSQQPKKEIHDEVLRIRANLIETLNDLSSENSMVRVGLEQLIIALGSHLQELKLEIKRLDLQLNNLTLEFQAALGTTEALQPEVLPKENHHSKAAIFTLNEMHNNVKETMIDIVSTLKGLSDSYIMMESLLLNQTRISSELQHRISDTRLVPFESIIPRLSRITRQVSAELKKEVNFKVVNTEGEMDRTLLEQLIPSLEHILRNAIDHGLEKPEIREKLQKPGAGQIVVSFTRGGGMVAIEIKDDGAGIDIEAVRKKAVHLGMLSKEAELTEQEVLRYILEPGFSTREEVTEVSGRGVGMDVVNTMVRKLGGNLHIESKRGIGTSITIRFPFTSSLNRILLFTLHKQTYGILLSSISSVTSMSFEKIEQILLHQNHIFEQEEKTYSLYYLGSLLDWGTKEQHIFKKKTYPVVLLTSSKNENLALIVDEVLFSRELVVQSLGSQFKLTTECVGATLLGDGRVVLILDTETLSDKARILSGEKGPEFRFSFEAGSKISDNPLIMVVDDSISIRTVTEKFLKKHQYRVMTAKDGLDALQKIEIETPDLILLDVDMPRMNGLEFGSTIRKDPRFAKIPIIILTARVSSARVKFAEEKQFEVFIEKPYEELDLLSNIRALLGKTNG